MIKIRYYHNGIIKIRDKGFTVNTNIMEVGKEYEFPYEDSLYQVSIDKKRTVKLEEIKYD